VLGAFLGILFCNPLFMHTLTRSIAPANGRAFYFT
jgi:hypothetical protein